MAKSFKNPANSAWHICKVCGKSRAIKSISHAKCVDILAKKAKERTVKINIKGRECAFSEDQIIAGKSNACAKNYYLKGDLPPWMFD